MQRVETTPATRLDMRQFNWREPIDSVGTDAFARQTVRALDQWAGVEHYAAFDLTGDKVELLSAESVRGDGTARSMATRYVTPDYVRRDPTLAQARRVSGAAEVAVLRVDPTQLADAQLRQEIYLSQNVCDRVFICGERDGHCYGVSLIRTQQRGLFNEAAVGCIQAMADTWLSLLAKHERMVRATRQPDPGAALLRPVPEIEVRLRASMPTLTRREAQVCARILRGMSTPGIAIDLGLQEDSVATYRKRAYRRLEIGTRFELIQRFVGAAASAAVLRH